MAIVNCPRCREQVSIPAGASTEALVQCPHCREEYLLDTALGQLPPELFVIDDPQATAIPAASDDRHEAAAFAAFAGAAVQDQAAEPITLAPEEDVPAFQFESGAPAAAAPSGRARRTRSARRQGSPMRQVVQIVAGGIAGVIIAQLILWWIPMNLSVSNRDLTGFGRKFGRYIPLVVPESIRGTATVEIESVADGTDLDTPQPKAKAEIGDDENEIPDFPFAQSHMNKPGASPAKDDSATTNNGKRQNREGRKPNERSSDATSKANDVGAASDDDQLTVPDTVPGDGAMATDALGNSMEFEVPPIDLTSPLEGPTLEIPPPSMGVPGADLEKPASAGAGDVVDGPPRLKNAPTINSGDVAARFSEANAALLSLDSAEEPDQNEKKRILANFYRSFAGLGEVLTYADQQDEAVRTQISDVDRLMQEIGTQAQKLEWVGAIAPSWLDHAGRPNDGVILYGTVKSVVKQGPYYETRLQLASSDQREIVLVGIQDPGTHYEPGDGLLALGAIVESPTQRLNAYAGDAALVVLDGRHLPIKQ